MGAALQFKSRYKADTADLGLMDWRTFAAEDADIPDVLQAVRLRGHDAVQAAGLPTSKLERFKYINIPAFLKKIDLRHAVADIAVGGRGDVCCPLVDAVKNAEQTGRQWITDMLTQPPIGGADYHDMMLWDLANAFCRDGVVVDVAADMNTDKPLNITFSGHDGLYFTPRCLIRLGARSVLNIMEYNIGSGAYWNNQLAQVHIEKGATLRHYRMQENSDQALQTYNSCIEVAEGATYETFIMTTGAGLSRNQIHVKLMGRGARCFINGINLLKGTQIGDTTITVEHCAPECVSKQNFRSVLDGRATGVFQGKVHVHQIAQQTDGYQLSNSLLLSGQATMNTKPELEIYADDVKCSHGATSGKLDEEALFYLRSRGVGQDDARGLLIAAFLSEVVDGISDPQMREQVDHIAQRWLDALKPVVEIDL